MHRSTPTPPAFELLLLSNSEIYDWPITNNISAFHNWKLKENSFLAPFSWNIFRADYELLGRWINFNISIKIYIDVQFRNPQKIVPAFISLPNTL